MSMRDWFAGQALAGLLGARMNQGMADERACWLFSHDGPPEWNWTEAPEALADLAYAAADAMLIARAARKEKGK